MKKKKVKKKVSASSGKDILFLHVRPESKRFLTQLAKKVSASEMGRVTLSTVADRLLKNLRTNSRLQKEALK